MNIPLITEIQRFCLQDGPGIRSTVFMKGCPLHCPWCHNPETINQKKEIYFYPSKCNACGECTNVCPSGSLDIVQTLDRGPALTIDRSKCSLCLKCVDVCPNRAFEAVGQKHDISSISRELLEDELFYKHSGGGVTISGGEPLFYYEFVYELTRHLKSKSNVHIAIETTCFSNWDRIQPLLDYVDLFIVDIKTMDADKHEKFIGGSLPVILSNIEQLIEFDSAIRIHLPIIPGFNDTSRDIDLYANYLGQFSEKISGVDVLPFHSYATGKYSQLGREYPYKGVNDLAVKEVMPLVNSLRQKRLRQVTVGGIVGTTVAG